MKNECNCGYSQEDMFNLSLLVDKKLAKVANRYKASKKYDLGIAINKETFLVLAEYKRILTNIIYCNDCYKDMKITDIVSRIKNKINEL